MKDLIQKLEATEKTKKSVESVLAGALGTKKLDVKQVSYVRKAATRELESSIVLSYGDRSAAMWDSDVKSSGWTMKDFVVALDAAGATKAKPKRERKKPWADHDGWAY